MVINRDTLSESEIKTAKEFSHSIGMSVIESKDTIEFVNLGDTVKG